MSRAFEEALRKTLPMEGGFSNDPKDSGGPTRWGITEPTARANGYMGPMEALPIEVASTIYRVQWWDLLHLDAVAALSTSIAEEVFDTSVHCGQAISAKFLQRALNVLNREGKDYVDIRVDGLVGPVTLAALSALLRRRGSDGVVVLLRVLNCLQGARYVELAEAPRRHKDERFTFGWFLQRVKV